MVSWDLGYRTWHTMRWMWTRRSLVRSAVLPVCLIAYAEPRGSVLVGVYMRVSTVTLTCSSLGVEPPARCCAILSPPQTTSFLAVDIAIRLGQKKGIIIGTPMASFTPRGICRGLSSLNVKSWKVLSKPFSCLADLGFPHSAGRGCGGACLPLSTPS